MRVDLTDFWKQQGDDLYSGCAGALLGFAEKAAAKLKPAEVSRLLTQTGAALSAIGGGEEPEDIEIGFEAPGLAQSLSALVAELTSATDFGAREIGSLLTQVASHEALASRDRQALATGIKILDLRSPPVAEAETGHATGMGAIREGLARLDMSGLADAIDAVMGIDKVTATDSVVSTASERLFREIRSAVARSEAVIRETGTELKLVSSKGSHYYKADVPGCITQEWETSQYFLGDLSREVSQAIKKLEVLHAIHGSDESIASFERNCGLVGERLPGSRDGSLAESIKQDRDNFTAFLAWYDALDGDEHRRTEIETQFLKICGQGRIYYLLGLIPWLEATRGIQRVKRKGGMVLVRNGG